MLPRTTTPSCRRANGTSCRISAAAYRLRTSGWLQERRYTETARPAKASRSARPTASSGRSRRRASAGTSCKDAPGVVPSVCSRRWTTVPSSALRFGPCGIHRPRRRPPPRPRRWRAAPTAPLRQGRGRRRGCTAQPSRPEQPRSVAAARRHHAYAEHMQRAPTRRAIRPAARRRRSRSRSSSAGGSTSARLPAPWRDAGRP